MSIKVINLSYKYLGEEIFSLKNINLKINEGECVAIMGSNGAGKTTLIKHFNGILKPTKGDVFIFNKNTKEATVAELSKYVGIVFQNTDHQLFASTVFEEISFALKNFGYNDKEIKEKVEEMLRIFSLEKYRNVSPLLLSGGEKKRVTIASILCYEPKIVVFDEPTIGLDFFQRKKLIHLISMLKNKGITVIIVTHDLDFISGIVNRIVLMNKGEIIKDGSVEEIFYDFESLEKANLGIPIISKIISKLNKYKKRVISVEDFVEHFKIYLKYV